MKKALEVGVKYLDVEARDRELHTKGPGAHFKPNPLDKQVLVEQKNQRLDDIYDDEPLGFEKYLVMSNANMLAQDPLK